MAPPFGRKDNRRRNKILRTTPKFTIGKRTLGKGNASIAKKIKARYEKVFEKEPEVIETVSGKRAQTSTTKRGEHFAKKTSAKSAKNESSNGPKESTKELFQTQSKELCPWSYQMCYNIEEESLEVDEDVPYECMGVVEIRDFPEGFYEDEMLAYFSQYGMVEKVQISRDEKTGHPNGPAFVIFKHKQVAKIASDSMDNYLMYDCLMKCTYRPCDETTYLSIQDSRNYTTIDKYQMLLQDRYNSHKSTMENMLMRRDILRKLRCLKKQLKSLGISFNADLVVNLSECTSYSHLDVHND